MLVNVQGATYAEPQRPCVRLLCSCSRHWSVLCDAYMLTVELVGVSFVMHTYALLDWLVNRVLYMNEHRRIGDSNLTCVRPSALRRVQERQARGVSREAGDGTETAIVALDLLAACAAHSPWAAAAVILCPGTAQALASALVPQAAAAHSGVDPSGPAQSVGEAWLSAAAIRVLKVC